MRDLTNIELDHVYGARGRGCSPCAPSKPPKCGTKGKGRSKDKGRSKKKGRSKHKGGSKGRYC